MKKDGIHLCVLGYAHSTGLQQGFTTLEPFGDATGCAAGEKLRALFRASEVDRAVDDSLRKIKLDENL